MYVGRFSGIPYSEFLLQCLACNRHSVNINPSLFHLYFLFDLKMSFHLGSQVFLEFLSSFISLVSNLHVLFIISPTMASCEIVLDTDWQVRTLRMTCWEDYALVLAPPEATGGSTTEDDEKMAFPELEPLLTTSYEKASFVFSRNDTVARLCH